ncbi:MAG: hypothetical protein EXR11_04415 [Rhodospirillaceae bacterium]|nr:hypothetical protein [Rhodospirillaceae bacterium]
MKNSTWVGLTAALAIFVSTAQAQQPAPHNPAMGDACAADIKTHCADAKPGQPTMQCVMKNRDKMSDGCKQAMAAMRGQGQGMGQGMGGGNAGPKMGEGGSKPQ